MLCDPHLATALDSCLDLRSPFYALYQAFLQISRLHSLLQGPLPNPRTQVLTSIERNVEVSLLTMLYQLIMLEFLEDLDRYLAELHCSSTNSSPSASSLPLNSHELTVMEWIESHWTSGDGTVPLPSIHACYHKACYQCHCLGHTQVNCHFYQCPTCLRWAPGHLMAHCPLCCHSSLLSLSSSCSSSPTCPIPIPPPSTAGGPICTTLHRNTHQVPSNRNICHPHTPYSSGQQTSSINNLNDPNGTLDWDKVAYANNTGSPGHYGEF